MEDAKARLEEYKNKIQPYPAYSEENPPEIKIYFRSRPIDDEVDQLKAGFIHLQKKHAEMMLAIDKVRIKKPKQIYRKYKDAWIAFNWPT